VADDKRRIAVDDLYKINQVEDPQISPDGEWIAFVRVTVDQMENGYQRNIWLTRKDGSSDPVQITRGHKDSNPRWSPDGAHIAFVSVRGDRPQIYVLPVTSPGGEARALTSADHGAFGPAWSPDGAHIAFVSPMNEDERTQEASGEKDDPPQDKLEGKHRKERSEHDEKERQDPYYMWRVPYRTGTSFLTDRYMQVFVVPIAEGLDGDDAKPRRLTDIDANHEPPTWSPDGEWLYTSRQVDTSRDEPFLDTSLFRINVTTGEGERFTEPGFSCFNPEPSPDGKWVMFVRFANDKIGSLLEGITRLAVMPAAGGEAIDLNVDLDRSVSAMVWASDSQNIIFTVESEGIGPIMTVPVTGGEVQTLSTGAYIAEALDVAADGTVAYVASTPLSPPELFTVTVGAEPTQMTAFNQNWLDEVILQETHEMWFTTPAGNDIQGWYILPVDYEEGKQYPLALNIHGGPHVMWGPSMSSMFHEWQFHAARGYVVFYCNPRGAAGYGEAFQAALHKAWGEVAEADIIAGVDALLEKGFVDADRMAITGGSYGGYMTAWIIGHTDRFKAAVPQRGVYSLISFYGTSDVPSLISGEFDVHPWEDYELLWKHSPLAHAHNIKTPTLIIHAENDYRVPIEQAEQLFAFIRRSGGTVEMWRYPRDGHELSRSGEPKHRESRLQKMIDWFDTYCQPGE